MHKQLSVPLKTTLVRNKFTRDGTTVVFFVNVTLFSNLLQDSNDKGLRFLI